jgi:hypothetical protein
MAKVTVHDAKTESPSQTIVKAANQPVIVTDALGRKIGIKKMKPLDRLKMFEVIGSGNSENQFYLGYASLAYHVTSIDGDPVNRPASKLQLEALVQRLEDEGMDAVAKGIEEHFAPENTDERATIKNS